MSNTEYTAQEQAALYYYHRFMRRAGAKLYTRLAQTIAPRFEDQTSEDTALMIGAQDVVIQMMGHPFYTAAAAAEIVARFQRRPADVQRAFLAWVSGARRAQADAQRLAAWKRAGWVS
jgi:hypothetical protein